MKIRADWLRKSLRVALVLARVDKWLQCHSTQLGMWRSGLEQLAVSVTVEN